MIYLRNIAFYAAFYGGSVAFVIGALLAARVAPARVRGWCDNWASWHHWCVTHLLGITVRYVGKRPAEQVFYAIKHEAFFEAIELAHTFDHPASFAKRELSDIPGWGTVSELYGNIPVAREAGATALRQMMRAVKPAVASGRPIAIFPEGTRVPYGTRPPLQSGFAALYKLIGLPVVPVAVDSGRLYQRMWKPRGTITVQFHEPIPPGLPRDEIEALVHAAINTLNAPPEG